MDSSPADSPRTGGLVRRYSFNDPAGIPASGNTGGNSNRQVSQSTNQFADSLAFATAPDTSVPAMGFVDNAGTHVTGIAADKPVSDRLARSEDSPTTARCHGERSRHTDIQAVDVAYLSASNHIAVNSPRRTPPLNTTAGAGRGGRGGPWHLRTVPANAEAIGGLIAELPGFGF